MQIELAGLVMQGMHDQSANSNILGQTDGSQNRILQQISAESFAMVGAINGQAAKYHDRHRVRHVAPKCTDSNGMINRTGSQCVVSTNDLSLIRDNKGARCTRRLVA